MSDYFLFDADLSSRHGAGLQCALAMIVIMSVGGAWISTREAVG